MKIILNIDPAKGAGGHVSLERIRAALEIVNYRVLDSGHFPDKMGGEIMSGDHQLGMWSVEWPGPRQVMDMLTHPVPGKAGRFELQVFDEDGRRWSNHVADGYYDHFLLLVKAFSGAIGHEPVGSVLVRDLEVFRQPTVPASPLTVSASKMTEMLELQSKEFEAMNAVATALKNLPAIVDDDYPEMRHRYDTAVRELVYALDNNGRLDRIKDAAIRKRHDEDKLARSYQGGA